MLREHEGSTVRTSLLLSPKLPQLHAAEDHQHLQTRLLSIRATVPTVLKVVLLPLHQMSIMEMADQ